MIAGNIYAFLRPNPRGITLRTVKILLSMGSKNLFDLMRKSRVVERKKRKDRAGGEPVLHNLTLVCDKSDKFDRIERTLVKLLEPMKLVGGGGVEGAKIQDAR